MVARVCFYPDAKLVSKSRMRQIRKAEKGEPMAYSTKERLRTPLVRSNGAHHPATWDEAMDRVARGLREQISDRGPNAFGMFSCSKATNELNYVAQKFARTVIGSNNIDSCNRT